MTLPMKIDNSSGTRTKCDTIQKHVGHKHNRIKAKRMLKNEEEPPSDYGKYKGWTT
jgi:hypothetical protein